MRIYPIDKLKRHQSINQSINLLV